jgi:hypothetical protein
MYYVGSVLQPWFPALVLKVVVLVETDYPTKELTIYRRKNVTAATNANVTEELLDASFSVRSVTHQRKVGY